MKPIPISAAKRIAQEHGYDQVVIIARKVDANASKGGEHVTTFGVDSANCEVAARIGKVLKHHLMAWPSALTDIGLRILGVGRDAENPKALSVAVSRPVSDDDIRTVHDYLTPPT